MGLIGCEVNGCLFASRLGRCAWCLESDEFDCDHCIDLRENTLSRIWLKYATNKKDGWGGFVAKSFPQG